MSLEAPAPKPAPAPPDNIAFRIEKRAPGRGYDVNISEADFRRAADILENRRKTSALTKLLSWQTFAGLMGAMAFALPFTVQYISWVNSASQDAAKDRVTRAATAFKEADDALNQRRYATLLLTSTIQDLGTRKDNATSGMSAFQYKLDQDRLDEYYKQLTSWNYNYNHYLVAIDYELDHPIFSMAGLDINTIVSSTVTVKANCEAPLFEQVPKLGYDSRALKAQFAVIQDCYKNINDQFGNMKEAALNNKDAATDKTASAPTDEKAIAEKKATASFSNKLANVAEMINLFECYAKHRIGFYIDESQIAIIRPTTVYHWASRHIQGGYRWVTRQPPSTAVLSTAQRALTSFTTTATACNALGATPAASPAKPQAAAAPTNP